MEFDQMYTGNLDWNFPSPTATPTTTTFGNNPLQTPKTSTFSSHFQDAFVTPQLGTFPTPQQIQFPTMTPFQRPQSSSDAFQPNYYSQQQSLANNGQQQLRPRSQSNFQQMGMGIGMNNGQGNTIQNNGHVPTLSPAFDPTFDSSKFQTPPPSRAAPVQKPQQQQQQPQNHVSFGASSTIASRRLTTPRQQSIQTENAATFGQHTPMQFPQLNFSPSAFQFGNGPASAPVSMHSQVVWGQTSPNGFAQQKSLDDPFAPNSMNDDMWQMSSMHNMSSNDLSLDSFGLGSFGSHSTLPRSNSALPLSTLSLQPQTSASVDPSLLYSSPIRPVSRSLSRPRGPRRDSAPNGVKRKDSAHFHSLRGDPTSLSDNSTALDGPGLRRSNTVGSMRGRQHPGMDPSDRLSRSSSVNHAPRAPSPLKKSRTSLGPISELKARNRSSVILTVDENGRARTEMRRSDISPTQSLRERYPGLYDDDSSDEEASSDTSDRPSSRSTSTAPTKTEERKAKAARLDPPVENLEGLNILRTGSSASMRGVNPSRAAIAAAASLRRNGSIRKLGSARKTVNKRPSLFGAMPLLADTCPMDTTQDHQANSSGSEVISPASTESEPVQQTNTDDFNSFNSNLNPNAGMDNLNVFNRRWSMMSFDQHQPANQSVSPQHQPQMALPQQQQQGSFNMMGSQNFVPAQVPLQPSGFQVRCICGVTNDRGQMLVQCNSCTQWLHSNCVGVSGHQQGYTCFLCTKPAPGMHAQRRGTLV